jgi:hypothetical protein
VTEHEGAAAAVEGTGAVEQASTDAARVGMRRKMIVVGNAVLLLLLFVTTIYMCYAGMWLEAGIVLSAGSLMITFVVMFGDIMS